MTKGSRVAGFRFAIAGVISLAAAPVCAQPVTGPYVAGSAGINLRAPQTFTVDPARPTPGPSAPGFPSTIANEPKPPLGSASAGSLGYGFGNGWRMEVEGGRRR